MYEKKLEQNMKQFRNTNLKTAFGTWKTIEENLLHKSQNADQQQSAETLDSDKEYVQETGHNFRKRYEEHINRLTKL